MSRRYPKEDFDDYDEYDDYKQGPSQDFCFSKSSFKHSNSKFGIKIDTNKNRKNVSNKSKIAKKSGSQYMPSREPLKSTNKQTNSKKKQEIKFYGQVIQKVDYSNDKKQSEINSQNPPQTENITNVSAVKDPPPNACIKRSNSYSESKTEKNKLTINSQNKKIQNKSKSDKNKTNENNDNNINLQKLATKYSKFLEEKINSTKHCELEIDNINQIKKAGIQKSKSNQIQKVEIQKSKSDQIKKVEIQKNKPEQNKKVEIQKTQSEQIQKVEIQKNKPEQNKKVDIQKNKSENIQEKNEKSEKTHPKLSQSVCYFVERPEIKKEKSTKKSVKPNKNQQKNKADFQPLILNSSFKTEDLVKSNQSNSSNSKCSENSNKNISLKPEVEQIRNSIPLQSSGTNSKSAKKCETKNLSDIEISQCDQIDLNPSNFVAKKRSFVMSSSSDNDFEFANESKIMKSPSLDFKSRKKDPPRSPHVTWDISNCPPVRPKAKNFGVQNPINFVNYDENIEYHPENAEEIDLNSPINFSKAIKLPIDLLNGINNEYNLFDDKEEEEDSAEFFPNYSKILSMLAKKLDKFDYSDVVEIMKNYKVSHFCLLLSEFSHNIEALYVLEPDLKLAKMIWGNGISRVYNEDIKKFFAINISTKKFENVKSKGFDNVDAFTIK